MFKTFLATLLALFAAAAFAAAALSIGLGCCCALSEGATSNANRAIRETSRVTGPLPTSG